MVAGRYFYYSIWMFVRRISASRSLPDHALGDVELSVCLLDCVLSDFSCLALVSPCFYGAPLFRASLLDACAARMAGVAKYCAPT